MENNSESQNKSNNTLRFMKKKTMNSGVNAM